MFFATRKYEIENYFYPDLIHELIGIRVTHTGTCDVKKIIGRVIGTKLDNVLDTFWPRMTGDKILVRSTYHDGVRERVEPKGILTGTIPMTH